MKNQIENSLVKMLALVLGIACAQPAPAQTFKRAKVQGGAALVQVSSGGASVWALASNGKPYILTTQICFGEHISRKPHRCRGRQ